MCVYSNVMDYGKQMWQPITLPSAPTSPPFPPIPLEKTTVITAHSFHNGPTKEQFEEFLNLLRAAKKFDEVSGQPDCELENKKELLRGIAKQFGLEAQIP